MRRGVGRRAALVAIAISSLITTLSTGPASAAIRDDFSPRRHCPVASGGSIGTRTLVRRLPTTLRVVDTRSNETVDVIADRSSRRTITFSSATGARIAGATWCVKVTRGIVRGTGSSTTLARRYGRLRYIVVYDVTSTSPPSSGVTSLRWSGRGTHVSTGDRVLDDEVCGTSNGAPVEGRYVEFTLSSMTRIASATIRVGSGVAAFMTPVDGAWATFTHVHRLADDDTLDTLLAAPVSVRYAGYPGASLAASRGCATGGGGGGDGGGGGSSYLTSWGLPQYGQLGNGNPFRPVAVDTAGVLNGKTVTAVAAGSAHTCALSAGTVYCWGGNSYGQVGDGTNVDRDAPVAVGGALTGKVVSQIASTGDYTCAVADGAAYCWGRNSTRALGDGTSTDRNTPVAVSTSGVLNGKTVTGVGAGLYTACAIAGGAAYCWGQNNEGQIGDGTQTNSSVPVPVNMSGVLLGKTVTAIAPGARHTCAVASGAAFCWGSGAVGNGTTPNASPPVAVSTAGALNGKTVTGIVGTNQTCSLASDGTVACWGDNGSGQLGDGTTTTALSPSAVDTTGVLSGKSVTALSAGTVHTCVAANGAAYCWGQNLYNGRLGDGTTTNRPSPVAVVNTGVLAGKTVTAVAGGGAHSCAIADGAVYCWGTNANGQLGDGPDTKVPGLVDTSGVLSGKTVTAIASGATHSCALADGAIYCWGDNSSGQLGTGTTDPSFVPVAVDASGALSGKTVTAITAGSSYTCAIAAGAAYCWGSNGNGRLGDGTTTSRSTPVAVDVSGALSGRTVTAIDAGTVHTCALAGGAAYCWGANGGGQVGDGTTTERLVPTAVDTSGVLSGKTLSAITAGSSFSCGLAVGAVYCWGGNAFGQLGDGTTTTRTGPVAVDTSGVLSGKTVSAISAGIHACVLAGGAAYCWGMNPSGQLGDGSTTNRSSPVAVDMTGVLNGKILSSVVAGNDSTCGLAAGAAYCWGANDNGKLGDGTTAARSTPVAVDTTGVLNSKVLIQIAPGYNTTLAM